MTRVSPGVIETRQPQAEAVRAIPLEEHPDLGRASHLDDRDSFGRQVQVETLCQRLDGDTVARALNEKNATRTSLIRPCRRDSPAPPTRRTSI
ncbi:MAG: hypothetical protein R2849_21835 [Thermomicrobiales bacterium]